MDKIFIKKDFLSCDFWDEILPGYICRRFHEMRFTIFYVQNFLKRFIFMLKNFCNVITVGSALTYITVRYGRPEFKSRLVDLSRSRPSLSLSLRFLFALHCPIKRQSTKKKKKLNDDSCDVCRIYFSTRESGRRCVTY